jgi:hypothetical protein
MGSGHFLVGATEFLAVQLLRAIEMDLEAGRLNESEAEHYTPDWAKRAVVSSCIYGVDINELAVELAKVSLWLATISKDKPLNFLDHHLKCGNSLVGAKIADLAWLPRERPEGVIGPIDKPLGLLQRIIERLAELEKIPDTTVDDVKRKENLFRQLKESEEYKKVRALANVHVGLWFSNNDFDSIRKQYLTLVDKTYSQTDSAAYNTELQTTWIKTATDESEKIQAFHWALEFPEIFVEADTPKENPGFDAVIGNPPYLRIQGLHESHEYSLKYFKRNYDSATGRYDFYVLFMERGAKLIKKNGYLAFIVPHKFTNSSFGVGIRKYLSKRKVLSSFLSFGHHFVWEEVTTYCGIPVIKNSPNKQLLYKQIVDLKTDSLETELDALVPEDFVSINQETLSEKPWILSSGISSEILTKIENSGPNIMKYFDKILEGIITGDDSVFLVRPIRDNGTGLTVSSEKMSEPVQLEKSMLKPILVGEDIKKYKYFDTTKHLVIFPYLIENGKQRILKENELEVNYPKTYAYLAQYREHLTELKKKFKTNPRYWYSLHRSRKIDWFSREKIVTPEITIGCNMTLDERALCHNSKVYSFIKKKSNKIDNRYFLAILNSKLTWFFLKATGYVLRGGFFTFKTRYLEPFNIPKPDQKTELKVNSKVELILELTKEFYKLISAFDHRMQSTLNVSIMGTNLEAFFRFSFQSFLSELQASKGIKMSLRDQDDWEAYFNASRPKLVELDARIQQVDSDLNTIVFGLYGLNEKEIEYVRNAYPPSPG